MTIYFEPNKSDFIWLDTRAAFPKLYREAFYTNSPDIQPKAFTNQFVKRIREAGLKTQIIQENVLLINKKIYVWITNKPLLEEKPLLKALMIDKKIARIGYLLRLDNNLEWGCVQISSKYLVNEESPVIGDEKS